jgi:hypothetical protein
MFDTWSEWQFSTTLIGGSTFTMHACDLLTWSDEKRQGGQGRAKIRSRQDVTAYFLHEHDWKTKKEGGAISLRGLSRRDSLE